MAWELICLSETFLRCFEVRHTKKFWRDEEQKTEIRDKMYFLKKSVLLINSDGLSMRNGKCRKSELFR